MKSDVFDEGCFRVPDPKVRTASMALDKRISLQDNRETRFCLIKSITLGGSVE